MRKNAILTFLCACIPGCGEMYQGYMKRGISIAALFWLLISVASFFYMEALLFALPVIWLYAFFDTFNIHSYTDEQKAANPDAYLFGLNNFDDDSLKRFKGKKHHIIGWALVAIGVYSLYTMVIGRIINTIANRYDVWWLYDIAMYTVPRAIVTLLIIMLGIWFIRGPKHTIEDTDDFDTFTPPTQNEETAQEDCTPDAASQIDRISAEILSAQDDADAKEKM